MYNTKIISIYSSTKGLGRTKYAVNFSAALAKLTKDKIILVDMGRPFGDIVKLLKLETKALNSSIITTDFGIDVLVPETFDEKQLVHLRLRDNYKYIVIDLPLELDDAIHEFLSHSDNVHCFVDSRMETLERMHKYLEDLREKKIRGLDHKIKIIVHRLNIFDKFSINEIVWLLKWDIHAVVPEADMLDMLIDRNGRPIVLNSPDSLYSKAVFYIAKEASGMLTGLALGSGAAFGLAHIGVLKVLEKEHIDIDIVSGSSIGALIAGMWGIGMSSAEIEATALKLKRKFNIMRLLDFTAPISGILAGHRLKRFLRNVLEEKTFEDLKIPVKIIAYDLANREPVTLESGLLIDAVYKSIAVPGILEPIKDKDRMIIDGGISDPVPVDVLIKNGAKKIIAVNVLPSPRDIRERNLKLREIVKQDDNILCCGSAWEKTCIYIKRFITKIFTPNIFDVIMTSIQALEYTVAENSCSKAGVVLNPVFSDASSIDFYLVKKFIDKGEEETLMHLKEIKALVSI